MGSGRNSDVGKPLPRVPLSALIHALSIDDRVHLRRVIARCVKSEDLSDSWRHAIENALDQMADAMSRGGWLQGLKRMKEERVKLEEKAIQARREEVKRLRESTERSKAKVTEDRGKQSIARSSSMASTSGEEAAKALSDLSKFALKSRLPSSSSPKHLLLTLRHSSSWNYGLSADLISHDPARAEQSLFFEPSSFSVPASLVDDKKGIILFGLTEWTPELANTVEDIQLVGGTFVMRSGSRTLQQSVANVLRICIFTRLSMTLEQFLLTDLGVKLHFPEPVDTHDGAPLTRFSSVGPLGTAQPAPPNASSSKQSLTKGIWTFISSKTERLLHLPGATHISITGDDPLPRTASLDFISRALSRPLRSSLDQNQDLLRTPSSANRSLSSTRDDTLFDEESSQDDATPPLFQYLIKRLRKSHDAFSTSVTVSFDVPPLLETLSKKESDDPTRRLRGDEKVALETVLGWEGRESRGRGMLGITGFARHQSITLLYSSTVPTKRKQNDVEVAPMGSDDLATRKAPCEKERWITYRYFSPNGEEDLCLGGFIELLCRNADQPCERNVGCDHKVVQHELNWLHAGVRITSSLSPHSSAADGIRMWYTCSVCQKGSEPNMMNPATYMMSFGKFIELLIYSGRLRNGTGICQHDTGDFCSSKERYFAYGGFCVRIDTVKFDRVFDVRVPRLQIERGERSARARLVHNVQNYTPPSTGRLSELSSDILALKEEMDVWYTDFEKHMQLLLDFLTPHSEATSRTPFPTPNNGTVSQDEKSDLSITPKPRTIPLPLFTPDGMPATSRDATVSDASSAPSQALSPDIFTLFRTLRQQLLQKKFVLYQAFSLSPPSQLNDIRRQFKSEAIASKKRLEAWQAKHLSPSYVTDFKLPDVVSAREPDWWRKECHAVPGGKFIAREGDWGSVIAATLGSDDYRVELARMSSPSSRATSLATSAGSSSLPPVAQSDSESSSRSVTPTQSLFTSSSSILVAELPVQKPKSQKEGSGRLQRPNPDDDDDSMSWEQAEAYTTLLTRREHPRDISTSMSLLSSSLRSSETLRNKRSIESASPSRFASISTAASRLVNLKAAPSAWTSPGVPASAWSRPATVEISLEAAGGQSHVQEQWKKDAAITAEKLLAQSQGAEVGITNELTFRMHSSPPKKTPGESSTGSIIKTSISRSDSASLMEQTEDFHSIETLLDEPPSLPAKDMSPHSLERDESSSKPDSAANSLTQAFALAMKTVLVSTGYAESSRTTHAHASPSKKHALLAVTDPTLNYIDPKPHIKYEWSVGNRIKLSCTVYYAQQFDSLRRRCGVEELFPRSLAKNLDWTAVGGKSKSTFWKTGDDRFIIKTLVNSWNVADLHVLIDIAPSYFKYMDNTSTRASVLAKLMGFYTVEMLNIQSGDREVMNLLVMENLFYEHKVVKSFDLKGIQGRKVKPYDKTPSGTDRTLFDSEWVEGQKKLPILITAHSKHVLQQAIKADADFLARNFIMDYSLLLGVDEERRQLVCGLVDTIGSFSLAKTLEWKVKQGINSSLNSGTKEVTILPPQDYHDRFVNAIESYFTACPDKWTKPLTNISHYSVEDLPSVL